MKTSMYCWAFLLLAFLSLPSPADAFSRRSSGSEVTSNQTVTTLKTNSVGTNDVSAQAVPEPPVLVLMSIGFGLFAFAYAIKGFRKQS